MFGDSNHSGSEACADGEGEEGFYERVHGRRGMECLLRLDSNSDCVVLLKIWTSALGKLFIRSPIFRFERKALPAEKVWGIREAAFVGNMAF